MTPAAQRRRPNALQRARLLFCLGGLGLTAGVFGQIPALGPDDSPAGLPGAAARTAPTGPTGEKAGVVADLGQGLRYLRVEALPAQLDPATAALKRLPLVLDLRRCTTSPGATEALRTALLAAANDAGGAVFILLGADTDPALVAAVPDSPRLVTVGVADRTVPVRMPVQTGADEDRAAYAAIVAGHGLVELTEEKVEKRRFDEARLSAAHANGRGRGGLALDSDPDNDRPGGGTNAAPADGDTAAPPKPPKDLVLQRAIFLHRALLALNRLPAHS